MTRTVEIYIDDLTPEARERFESVVGTEHNYDVFPICTYESEMDDGSQAIPEEIN